MDAVVYTDSVTRADPKTPCPTTQTIIAEVKFGNEKCESWSTFWDIRGPMSFQPAVRLCGAKALARVKASTGKAEEEAWNKARNCKT